MKFEICYSPAHHIIIHDLFPESVNQKILEEVVKCQVFFQEATTGRGVDPEFRSNLVAYYDDIFIGNRDKCTLIKEIESIFANNTEFKETLASSPYPISEFLKTNYHETQVSRYGNNQKYDFHIDRSSNDVRLISFVYYFFKEPREWTDGFLELTGSPVHQGKMTDPDAEIKSITPYNNMAVVFSSSTAHRVKPTKSVDNFGFGRFSMNCWVGIQ